MKKLVVGMFALLPLLFIGCSEDEDPDLRDVAVGEYSGTSKIYFLESGNLFDLDADENVEFTVTKSTNDNTLKINIEGDIITATKITTASNGFAFDVNSIVIDGDSYTGYQGISIENVKYHGRFESNSERLTVFIQTVLDGETYVIRVQGDL